MQAVGLLRNLGYLRVGHYPGGMEEWLEHGEPVESGVEAGPLESRSGNGGATIRIAGQDAQRGRSFRAFVRRPGLRPLVWFERLADLSYSKLLVLWLGMVLGFGILDWLLGSTGLGGLLEHGKPVSMQGGGLLTSLYFSFVTATSIGFGDVVPVGLVRLFVVVEGAAALLMFSCIVSKLLSRRQDELAEDTHRIAFEERLGRVRTNLHLVLAELQAIEDNVEATDGAGKQGATSSSAAHTLARLESATIVFSGELLTVHELLYRPQLQPDETVIEGLLANLATDLDELRMLLERLPEARRDSALLDATVRSIGARAGEICGECVPKQYAPALRVWMNRVQGLSRDLSRSE